MRSQPGTEQSLSFLFFRALPEPLLDVVDPDRVGVIPGVDEDDGVLVLCALPPLVTGVEPSLSRVSIGGGRMLLLFASGIRVGGLPN